MEWQTPTLLLARDLGPDFAGDPAVAPRGLAHYIQAQTHKGVELVNWYLGICRGEQAPLGRVPKAAERFETPRATFAHAGPRIPGKARYLSSAGGTPRGGQSAQARPSLSHRGLYP